ncbi:hypothetical protein [Kumtagia ephedrae]|uniref:Class I SAM-dependent methyltransferase n=1 Tax=Kumtagia ephedrae TaxID=2116701 RepID=A0A2P7S210_9HYPH|nr:hypothetical protein [Mesorhizobium ephedrae]PSJ56514.1 hypothetical protein C7I84_20295 [Mesorhizobium ephedrae]
MDEKYTLTMPEAEADCVRAAYEAARVILEYGSGGSTVMASKRPGKLIFSVESDRDWAMGLQLHIDEADLPSPAMLYHVDIGPTGTWGRPRDSRSWQLFHRYPLAIWDEPFFRQPDVVLIDGRFRPACLAAVCMMVDRPVTVLFDDYVDREAYHQVEEFVKPTRTIGRMAEFHVEPGLVERNNVARLIAAYAEVTYAKGKRYQVYNE